VVCLRSLHEAGRSRNVLQVLGELMREYPDDVRPAISQATMNLFSGSSRRSVEVHRSRVGASPSYPVFPTRSPGRKGANTSEKRAGRRALRCARNHAGSEERCGLSAASAILRIARLLDSFQRTYSRDKMNFRQSDEATRDRTSLRNMSLPTRLSSRRRHLTCNVSDQENGMGRA
jgi:hypothetical protein